MSVAQPPVITSSDFRYDPEALCWKARSRSRDREHELHWAISGTTLITTCSCEDSIFNKHLCAHQFSFAAEVLPTITPGAVIHHHVTCAGGPIDLHAATKAERTGDG